MSRTKKTANGKEKEHFGFQNFSLVRRITRELFVNGYRNYKEYVRLSSSTYYNRLSLITNCLSTLMEWPEQGYMCISTSRMRVVQNPMYQLFKARPMKNNYQYALHFALIDMFSDGKKRSLSEISHLLADVYNISDDAEQKNKLLPRLEGYYLSCGLLSKDQNKKYSRSPLALISTEAAVGLLDLIPGLADAIAFFSEYSPLGVIGSYLMDAGKITNECFAFKHYYLSQALDAQVVYDILHAIQLGCCMKIYVEHTSDTVSDLPCFLPLKILSETTSGRQFVYGYDIISKEYRSLRIDYIESASALSPADSHDTAAVSTIQKNGEKKLATVWSSTVRKQQFHVKVIFLCKQAYQYEQIFRERRTGTASVQQDNKIVYECDVDEPKEMMGWLLSHIGMIVSIQVTGGKRNADNNRLINRFKEHLFDMQKMYESEYSLIFPAKHRYHPIDYTKWRKLNSGEDHSELFHHVYSQYLLRIQSILEAACVAKTEQQIKDLIRDITENQFSDLKSVISFESLLDNGMLVQIKNTQDGEKLYRSFLTGKETAVLSRPLTYLERSWLTAILEDPMITLFISQHNIELAKSVLLNDSPLYSPKDIIYKDQYLNGDDISNSLFQKNFRKLQKAIFDGYTRVLVTYQSENDKRRQKAGYTYEIIPFKIEYSKQANRFWLLCNIYHAPENSNLVERESSLTSLKLSNISHVELLPKETGIPQYRHAFEQIFEDELCKQPISVRLNDYGNAIERFMIAFSPYKKETHYDYNKNNCTVKLWYSKNDKKEVLLKLRSFGKSVEILQPQKIRKDILSLVERQISLINDGNSELCNSANK